MKCLDKKPYWFRLLPVQTERTLKVVLCKQGGNIGLYQQVRDGDQIPLKLLESCANTHDSYALWALMASS